MKKHLLTAFLLLLLSTTVTLAQMGSVVDEKTASDYAASVMKDKAHGRGFKLPVGDYVLAGTTDQGGRLSLRSDALVMDVIKTVMAGDDFVPNTTQLWAIPFPSPAKELEFTPQGELIVRGQNNQILFKATEQPGEWLKVTPTGLLKIDGKDRNGKLFILWSK